MIPRTSAKRSAGRHPEPVRASGQSMHSVENLQRPMVSAHQRLAGEHAWSQMKLATLDRFKIFGHPVSRLSVWSKSSLPSKMFFMPIKVRTRNARQKCCRISSRASQKYGRREVHCRQQCRQCEQCSPGAIHRRRHLCSLHRRQPFHNMFKHRWGWGKYKRHELCFKGGAWRTRSSREATFICRSGA